jgi:lipopolysaccharide/colanic/teichoic acid biosynthesis glycosyltransferase
VTQESALQRNHWYRLRWQIVSGLIAATLPIIARLLLIDHSLEQGFNALVNAFWGGLIAILLGILLIRNVGRYPGVERASAIIPGFSVSFGILVVSLLMLRLDYSRWALGGAYFCAIFIFYLGYTQIFGRRRLKIAVIPLGDDIRSLLGIPGIDWIVFESPDRTLPGVDAVAVDLRIDLPDAWDQRIADLALTDVPVYHSKHLMESLTGRVELEHLSETSYGTLSPPDNYMIPKSIIDRLAAAVALVILAPFLGVVAVLIRFDSSGPAIFRQERIGFRGEPFTVYKFRTMRTRTVDQAGARDDAITRTNDDRITRLGRFLRRSRIDELPQIINILKGEMSWIGPRPEAAVLSKWYEDEIPFYRYRHVVRPGVTGWAQVMQGHVADVSEVRSKLYYDFYYIKNFSLWIDSLIVFRTMMTMLTGFGAK